MDVMDCKKCVWKYLNWLGGCPSKEYGNIKCIVSYKEISKCDKDSCKKCHIHEKCKEKKEEYENKSVVANIETPKLANIARKLTKERKDELAKKIKEEEEKFFNFVKNEVLTRAEDGEDNFSVYMDYDFSEEFRNKFLKFMAEEGFKVKITYANRINKYLVEISWKEE